MPIHRFHVFERSFEPLKFALNGRKGRRVGCILGNLGRVLEVLDLDEEEPEAEDGADEQSEAETVGIGDAAAAQGHTWVEQSVENGSLESHVDDMAL